VELPENSTPGTSVVQVHATDCDTTGSYGRLLYAQLIGSEAFHLNPLTGEISVDNPNLLDRETQSGRQLKGNQLNSIYSSLLGAIRPLIYYPNNSY